MGGVLVLTYHLKHPPVAPGILMCLYY